MFVGSLRPGSKPEELRKLFEKFGTVTECDIMNRCGFVHMETEEQAQTAIRMLNNTVFNGGVINVERGRIKEQWQGNGGPQRRGGGVGRGGMRGGMDRRPGGPMRGPAHIPVRDAPYMREPRHMGGPMRGDMRGPHMGGPMRNGMGGGYDRQGQGSGYPDDRYNGGYDDRRGGYGGMDNRRDPYAAPGYDDRRYGQDDLQGYPDDRRAPLYPDERDLIERRPPMRAAGGMPMQGYDRAPPRQAPLGNGDLFSRRSPAPM